MSEVKEYVVTVTAVVEAEDEAGASDEFYEWLFSGDRDVEVSLLDPEDGSNHEG
jgi:hypothetical protein